MMNVINYNSAHGRVCNIHAYVVSTIFVISIGIPNFKMGFQHSTIYIEFLGTLWPNGKLTCIVEREL